MKFVFVSDSTFEPWDWTNPDTVGIGGSETSHIEMARRLAEAGHQVISYAPTPFTGPIDGPGHVTWFRCDQINWAAPDVNVWVLYRAPHLADHLPAGATAWLICQDTDYEMRGNELTAERLAKFTRIVALCGVHGDYLKAKYPAAKARVCVSSNGVKAELIRQIAADPPERNPLRMMYASSPDRGLETLLEIFPRIAEQVEGLELHIYYGFDNIDKVIAHMGENHRASKTKKRIAKMFDHPGITYHGRTPQPELLREWFKAGIWCHPSNFTETSCITCMDAQACGAIPVTSPVWAISENVQHGFFIEGNVKNPLVRARYIHSVFSLALQPNLQDQIRGESMPWALDEFDWANFTGQWEGWARFDAKAKRRTPQSVQASGIIEATRAALAKHADVIEWPALGVRVPDVAAYEAQAAAEVML